MANQNATGDKIQWTNTSTAGWNCITCGQWISNGTFHYCQSYATPQPSQYQYQICGKCGYHYQGSHICPMTTSGTTTTTNLYQLDNILVKLNELLKRIENIEKILDEEL